MGEPISPLRTTWWCTYCGEEHEPTQDYTNLDPRYATARCRGAWRPLVTDQRAAKTMAATGGLNRPKGTPIGGSQPRPVLARASAAETRALLREAGDA